MAKSIKRKKKTIKELMEENRLFLKKESFKEFEKTSEVLLATYRDYRIKKMRKLLHSNIFNLKPKEIKIMENSIEISIYLKENPDVIMKIIELEKGKLKELNKYTIAGLINFGFGYVLELSTKVMAEVFATVFSKPLANTIKAMIFINLAKEIKNTDLSLLYTYKSHLNVLKNMNFQLLNL